LAFGLGIASLAEPGTISGDATANHDLADVLAVEVADPDAAIMGALAV
jgi:hypothetical protein